MHDPAGVPPGDIAPRYELVLGETSVETRGGGQDVEMDGSSDAADEHAVSAVRAYDEGLYTFPELASKLLELAETHSLDDLTRALPEPLRARCVEHLRARYANDLPPDAFVSIKSDARMTPELLETLRAWLSRQG
jgi:hypothetical protein